MADSFGDRVAAAVRATGPLCAGIDPSAALLDAWGLPDDAPGLRAFGATCIEAFAGVVGVVKPQVAFFERHGAAGLAELCSGSSRPTRDERGSWSSTTPSRRRVGDTTVQAYADAWVGDASPLAADALTVHAYLGLGALAPLIRLAAANGRGVIVVARSSNPEGRSLQQAITAEGASVEDMLLGEIAALNESAKVPAGTVGAVIGATLPPSEFPLSQLRGSACPGPRRAGSRPGRRPSTRLRRLCRRDRLAQQRSRGLLQHGPHPDELRRHAQSLVRELKAAMG